MNDQQQLLEAIEKSNKAFADFKAINEAKLKAAEDRGTEFEASLKRAFDEIHGYKETIEKLEAKLTNRPGNGDSGNEDADHKKALADHRAGFIKYLRKGDDRGLVDLERKTTNDITTGADGLYAVPTVINDMIEGIVVNISPVRQIAQVIQVSTSDFHKLVNLRGTAS